MLRCGAEEGQIVMLLTVPGAAAVNSKYRQSSSDNRTSPAGRRAQQVPVSPDLRSRRRASDSDDDDAGRRHHYIPSAYRGATQPAAAAQYRADNETAASSTDPPVSARRKPANQSSSSPTIIAVPLPDDERPRSCEPAVSKPILAVDRQHDCSMENVRSFVDGVQRRRRGAGGGPVVGSGRHGCSTEVLMQAEDASAAGAAGRKSVRFAGVVRVCDPLSTITFCSLRHQSASSAPAVLEGTRSACALPPLTPGGCVGGAARSRSEDRDDELDLPAEVERCMARRRHNGDVDQRADDVHRFPPLRRRRT